MESLKKLNDRITSLIDTIDTSAFHEHLTLVGTGQIQEIFELSERPNGYYRWINAYVALKKPKQVVELGAAAGISTILMAFANPKTRVVSVDCDPMAWRWMNREYSNVTKVYGDDLDLSIYPNDVNLSDTDFWFFDSLHTRRQLESELALYRPFFKKGTILAFDDIHINEGMNDVWESLPYEKLDISERMHYTGWGIAKV